MKYNVTASRIMTAMADAGISQQELSNKSGINKSSISHYVNGTHAPGNKAAYAMAQVLDVDPLWLMGLDVPEVKNVPALNIQEIHNIPTARKLPTIQIESGKITGQIPKLHKTMEINIDMEKLKADQELLSLFHNATQSARESVMTLLENSQMPQKPKIPQMPKVKVARVIKKGRA
jgi:transcriptional regulator with XRE-family HTH domain